MAKKWICLILAAVLACSLCACGDNPPTAYDPTDHKQVAEKFLEAYYFGDRLTTYPMYFYDRQQLKKDELIKTHGSAEKFFALVQQQAEAQGIDVTINSFDDFYAAFYKVSLEEFQATYGDYTVTTTATVTKKLEGEALDNFRTGQLGAIDAKYIDADAFNAVTEAYTVTVNIRIDGEKKDYNENYLVHLVRHDGRWLVVSHSI